MFLIKGFCAGILVFKDEALPEDLDALLKKKEEELRHGDLMIRFGVGMVQVATEICVDVYEEETKRYRRDLSTAYKR